MEDTWGIKCDSNVVELTRNGNSVNCPYNNNQCSSACVQFTIETARATRQVDNVTQLLMCIVAITTECTKTRRQVHGMAMTE